MIRLGRRVKIGNGGILLIVGDKKPRGGEIIVEGGVLVSIALDDLNLIILQPA